MLSESRNPKPLELNLVVAIYLLMALIAGLWDLFSRGHFFYAWIEASDFSFMMLVAGSVLVTSYIGLSWLVNRFFVWARQLERLFAKLLTPISYFQILIISLLSGFIEEWFFRGVLLSHFGLLVSSIAFGLCHFIPEKRLWVWGPWAFAAGLVFGKIYEISDSLLLCALVHSSINAILLILLNIKVLREPQMSKYS